MTQFTARLNLLLLGISVLSLTAGCAGRQITASAQDAETVLQAQTEAPTIAGRGEGPTPREETRPLDTGAPAGAPVEERVQPEPLPQPVAPIQEARVTDLTTPAAEMGDAFFDFDRFSIRDDARTALERDAAALKDLTNWKLLIEGHCDERGTADYNLVLGERRAQAARHYLETLGLDTTRIQITSYGKERPFCGEHSSLCWQQNRRAHLVKQ